MNQFDEYLKAVGEVGHVKSSAGFLVYCTGLLGARIGEKVVFENGASGMVYAIVDELVEILLFDTRQVDVGMMVARSGETLMVTVSEEGMGRILDPFGNPLDGRGRFKKSETRFLEQPAPAMIDRVRINQSLETGVTVVDLLVPIGRGQRQLVIGDQKTGKTSFLLQTIARQVQLGTICIYVCLGKKKSDLTNVIDNLTTLGVRDKTIIVAAPASVPSSLIYVAPFSAFSIAEHFRARGKDVLIVLDEISRHAKYYRELSILGKKMPGRDGYPGDIFYLHSHLMERAGRFIVESTKVQKYKSTKEEQTLTLKIEGETASITCLPVVETLGSDFTGYIQTNLMSMTDGHLFFDMNSYQQGQRPAINIGLSVTRVGKQTQKTIERDIAIKVREILFEYTKARDVAKFGVELLVSTQEKVVLGEKLLAIFDQDVRVIVPKMLQLLFIELLLSDFWQSNKTEDIKRHKDKILAAYEEGKLKKLENELQGIFDLGAANKFSETIAKWKPELEKIVNGR